MTVSADPIDLIFDDLYYPGSKKLRRPEPEEKANESSWDSTPIVKVHRGERTEFFFPNALARALGKSVESIRLWERRGYIPKAPFRLPGYTDAKGVRHPGKRVYTRELIQIAIEEFGSRDLLGAARVEWRKHDDLTIALFERWNAANTEEK